MELRVGQLVAAAGLILVVGACGSSSGHVQVGPGGSTSGGTGPAVSVPTSTGDLSDCKTILATYLSLAATAIKGQDAAASAEKVLEDIKSKLPADLQGDLAVVASAFGAIAQQGVAEGVKALGTDAFKTANANILRYLQHDCLPG